MSEMKLRITTPLGIEYDEKIERIHVTSLDGDLTILPHHFPLLTNIKTSICHFVKDGELVYAFVDEGIMHVDEEGVELIVASFSLKEDIDIERARKAKSRAESRLSSNEPGIDLKRAQKALIRADARINLWEK